MGGRVVHGATTELPGLGVVERRCGAHADGAQVEVRDDLVDDVGVVLDECRPGLDVAGGAEAAEHGVAEAVSGGDGGLVEACDGAPEPTSALGALGLGCVQQEGQERVGLGRAADGEGGVGLHEALAHAVLQLGARGSAEGDDQQVVELGVALGDQSGDERGDGPGLAGAGAGLEQRGAGGQRVGDVELGDVDDGRVSLAHQAPSKRSSSGVQRVTACWSSPRVTSAENGRPGP